jgi:uncharacterized short protein YbdD (DUF466 family)
VTGTPVASLLRGVRGLRWYLREVSGESGYDRYLRRHRDTHPDAPPLSRREFERRRMDDRDARPQSRCC